MNSLRSIEREEDARLRIVIKTIDCELYNLLVKPDMPVVELKEIVKVSYHLKFYFIFIARLHNYNS